MVHSACKEDRDNSLNYTRTHALSEYIEPSTRKKSLLRIDESEFDFGALLARGQILRHEFKLTNLSERTVRLLGSQAMTPCCSSIGPLPDVIPPGGVVKIPISFRPGHGSSRKRVEFTVRADVPDVHTLVLAVRAAATAEIEIRRDAPIVTLPIGRSGRQNLTIVSRRIGQEGRESPDGIEATLPLTAAFVGPKEERSLPGLWTETLSKVEVVMPAIPREGHQAGSVTLTWDGSLPVQVPIEWRVSPHIVAIPASLILEPWSKASGGPYTFILRSENSPFRITSISGPLRPTSPDTFPATSGREHRIELEFDGAKNWKPGPADVTISTDHPDQRSIDITVLLTAPIESEDE